MHSWFYVNYFPTLFETVNIWIAKVNGSVDYKYLFFVFGNSNIQSKKYTLNKSAFKVIGKILIEKYLPYMCQQRPV